MPPSPSINQRARSKHVGHACEGHLAGIIEQIARATELTVTRELPIATHVEPDVVILDSRGRVSAVFIVSYWESRNNSDSKFYRTRSEYLALRDLSALHPEAFSKLPLICTVLYGLRTGWKPTILRDLATTCRPLIFLPDLIGDEAAVALTASAFDFYRQERAKGVKDARAAVQQWVSGRTLERDEKKLMEAIKSELLGVRKLESRVVNPEARTIRLPSSEIRTRYRQGLGILSCFAPAEIAVWHTRRVADFNQFTERFAKRAWFLGVGEITARPTILRNRKLVSLQLCRPFKNDQYKPDLPDLESWQSLEPTDIEWILSSHRARLLSNSDVFAGGAFDQCAGAYEEIARVLSSELPKLIRILQRANWKNAADTLAESSAITAPKWHPASGTAFLCPLWAMSVCALAIAQDVRKLRQRLNARAQSPPTIEDARIVARSLVEVEGASNLLAELEPAMQALLSGSVSDLAGVARPRLLMLRDEPASWVADVYNTLTSNSSHNPLNEILLRWMTIRYPTALWSGWPAQRSVSISRLLNRDLGRREWTLAAMIDGVLVGAECKAVTANHWGDKSKELYDRVQMLRNAGAQLGVKTRSILLFDGDLGSKQMEEMATGIGHDEVWGVDEILELLRGPRT